MTVQTVPTSPRRAALRDPQAANRRRSFGDGIVAHRGNRQARRMGEFWFIAPGHGPYGNAISVAMRSLRFTSQKKGRNSVELLCFFWQAMVSSLVAEDTAEGCRPEYLLVIPFV